MCQSSCLLGLFTVTDSQSSRKTWNIRSQSAVSARYPPVYIISLPILLPPKSSISLHSQARYLHSFSMLNCILKAHFLPEAIHLLSGPLMKSCSFDSESFSCFQYDKEWFYFFLPNTAKRPTSLVRISFEVSRVKRAELQDRKVLLRHDILKTW